MQMPLFRSMAVGGLALVVSACGGTATSSTSPSESPSSSAAAVMTASKAADLRTKLNLLLGEHLILASKATGAALGGRAAEFQAYGGLLNTNGTDIGDMLGAAFGPDAKTKFNQIWSAHDGFFVDYTKAVAANDAAMKQQAVTNLTTVYVPQFADFIAGATGLPKDTITRLTTQHVTTTAAVVDAQGAKDWPKAAAAVRTAYAHMEMLGDPLAEAIAAKQPGMFPGDAKNKAVDFRTKLNLLLQEHLYLATMATGPAVGGRTGEFSAFGEALGQNGTDIGVALGGIYGTDAQAKFNQIWSAHNGFFVDYTKADASGDAAAKQTAVDNLTKTYVPQFAQFLAGATGLQQDTVASLVSDHVTTTAAVVDAQVAKNAADAAARDRTAGQHMEMIGDPLAAAIVTKMPDKFTG